MENLINPEDFVSRLMEAFANDIFSKTTAESQNKVQPDPLNDFSNASLNPTMTRSKAFRNVFEQANQSGIPDQPLSNYDYTGAMKAAGTSRVAPTLSEAADAGAALGANTVMQLLRIPSTALAGLVATGAGASGLLGDAVDGVNPFSEKSGTRYWYNEALNGVNKYFPLFSGEQMLSTVNPFYDYDQKTHTYGNANWPNITESVVGVATLPFGGVGSDATKPITVNTAAKSIARQAAFNDAAQAASKRGLLTEIPPKPTQTFEDMLRAGYNVVDNTNPAAWTGRPNITTSLDDFVSQGYEKLGKLATSTSKKMLFDDADRIANNIERVVVEGLPTPDLNRFSSSLIDELSKYMLEDPLKITTKKMGARAAGEGIESALDLIDPTSPENIRAQEDQNIASALAERINQNTAQPSQTAQQNTESAGGSQTPSQPVPTYDAFARRPAPLIPTDPTLPNLFIDRTERPNDFNVVSGMNPTSLRDWYLKQTNGALDIGPIFNIVKDLPDDFSKYEAAKAALTEAVNNAGLEANDSWLSTIGWLITIPFAIRRGMSPDEVWEKIVNSRIAINPQVRQAQTALENIEALRNARLELLNKVNPLIAYAIQGTSNPELAEARVVNALANAQQSIARGNLYNAQTKKTETFNNYVKGALGQGTSGQGTSKYITATQALNAKSNK